MNATQKNMDKASVSTLTTEEIERLLTVTGIRCGEMYRYRSTKHGPFRNYKEGDCFYKDIILPLSNSGHLKSKDGSLFFI